MELQELIDAWIPAANKNSDPYYSLWYYGRGGWMIRLAVMVFLTTMAPFELLLLSFFQGHTQFQRERQNRVRCSYYSEPTWEELERAGLLWDVDRHDNGGALMFYMKDAKEEQWFRSNTQRIKDNCPSVYHIEFLEPLYGPIWRPLMRVRIVALLASTVWILLAWYFGWWIWPLLCLLGMIFVVLFELFM